MVGDDPFAVILADDLIDAPKGCIGQLIEARASVGGGSVVAVQDVAPEETKKYGIVSVDDGSLTTPRVRGIVEKPDPSVAPSRMAVIGRYVFEADIFDHLARLQPGVGGEIQLTDGIAASLENVPTYAAAASRVSSTRRFTSRASAALKFTDRRAPCATAPWWSVRART